MTAFNFPTGSVTNDEYTAPNGRVYIFDGDTWDVKGETFIVDADVSIDGELIITLLGGGTINAGVVTGDTGPSGSAGANGADGADGADGVDGIGITNIVDNGDGTLTITFGSGSMTTTTNSLQGPSGSQGPTGATGPSGSAGPTGATGPSGSEGPIGGLKFNYTDGINDTPSTGEFSIVRSGATINNGVTYLRFSRYDVGGTDCQTLLSQWDNSSGSPKAIVTIQHKTNLTETIQLFITGNATYPSPTVVQFAATYQGGDSSLTDGAQYAFNVSLTGAKGDTGEYIVSGSVNASGSLIIETSDANIIDAGNVIGPQGDAATISIGTVTTGAAYSSASVSNSGDINDAIFDFTIPQGIQGIQGIQGDAATISIGTVTTGDPGSNATVTNSGTSGSAILNFSIPRGDIGATGPSGSQGIQGIQGIQGDAATVSIGTVTTGATGSNATVTNSGTSGSAILNFSIPRGDTGATGAQGIQGAKGDAGGLRYTYNSTYNANPSAGQFTLIRSNPSFLSTVSEIRLSHTVNGTDISSLYDDWDNSTSTPKAIVTFTSVETLTEVAQFNLTSTVSTGFGYSSFNASFLGGSSTFTNGDDFTIQVQLTGQKGDQGIQGEAATIAVGTVVTGSEGSNATVTNSGTSGSAVFDFVIPVGATGATGPKGDTGALRFEFNSNSGGSSYPSSGQFLVVHSGAFSTTTKLRFSYDEIGGTNISSIYDYWDSTTSATYQAVVTITRADDLTQVGQWYITNTLSTNGLDRYTEFPAIFAGGSTSFTDGEEYNVHVALSGEKGPTGSTGATGATGPQGPQGIQGEPGPSGSQGPVGPSGSAGLDGVYITDVEVDLTGSLIITLSDTSEINAGSVIGPQGEPGPSGSQGPSGSAGLDGTDGVDGVYITTATVDVTGSLILTFSDASEINAGSVIGPQGEPGPSGSQGPTGDTGPSGSQGLTGPSGADGADGLDGVGITDIADNGDGTLTLTYGISGSTVTTIDLTGPSGSQGPQGDPGPSGSQGPQGIQGETGPSGSQGLPGTNGVGITNIADNGDGTLTLTYGSGSTVTTGDLTGPSGSQGPQGIQGEPGPSGSQGPTGATGPQGIQGEQGLQGIQGIPGPSGSQGPQGEIGPSGSQGPQGEDGLSAYELAQLDGYPFGVVTWLQSLQGETGPAGPTGSQGPQGETGPAGPTGSQGPQGDPGPSGSQGPPGQDSAARYQYRYSTTTSQGDPGAGYFRLNNSTMSSATQLYIDTTDYDQNAYPLGNDLSTFLSRLTDYGSASNRGFIKIEKASDSTWYQQYIFSTVTNSSGYYTITLQNTISDANFTNNDTCFVSFILAGPVGSSGLGVASGGNDGQLLAKASNSENDTEWVDRFPMSFTSGSASGAALPIDEHTQRLVYNTTNIKYTLADGYEGQIMYFVATPTDNTRPLALRIECNGRWNNTTPESEVVAGTWYPFNPSPSSIPVYSSFAIFAGGAWNFTSGVFIDAQGL